jgi:hypothetical protein
VVVADGEFVEGLERRKGFVEPFATFFAGSLTTA